MQEHHMSLITDYIDGTLSAEREREFRQYVAEGHIVMEEVEAMKQMQGIVNQASQPEPSPALSTNFYQMLAEEKKAQTNTGSGFLKQLSDLLFSNLYGRMSFGMVLLLIGVFSGSQMGGSSDEIKVLTERMEEMQATMMVSMLEEESVIDRLKGIQISQELPKTNEKVANALFMTLNNDESTNVRMAALQTLEAYADDPAIREGLINSITQQESPLMQVALAELMVELQERKSIDQFKQLLEKEGTPEEVKSTLKESIGKIM